MDTSPGTTIHGFVVRRVTPVQLLGSLAIELEHEATGLRLLHVKNDDNENLFSIVFATPPSDDTGVPHILEHSVLAGSHKFPAREGFFELTKRSPGTFINAMTASEHTLYPVSSAVPKDLFNLAEVYWDAVFHPLLTEHTFRREGHRLELASADDLGSELVVKGIVYSEMQGAYSSAESLIGDAMNRNLFPDSPYGRDSGGDPDAIPTLSYEGLRSFHAGYYGPSQAMVVVYGNIPTERYLAFAAERLAGESRRAAEVSIARQPRWTAPREARITCPVSPNEAGRSWLSLSWICGDGTDPMDSMQLALLEQLLVGHPGAVLRKAILDSKVGEDLALTFLSAKCLDATFSVGVRGTQVERADQFVAVVLGTLGSLVSQGIDRHSIETACQQLSYATLEIGDLFPIQLLWKLSTQYVLTGDPIPVLRSAEHLRTVRERALSDPSHLTRLLRERLLDNPHRLLVVARGDPEFARRRDEALAQRLRTRKAAMSQEQLARIAAETEEFERLEQQKDDLEAFERLPKLGPGDLPRRPRTIPTLFERDGRLEFLDNRVFSNGINYLQLDIDLAHLPAALLAYVGPLSHCLGKLGAGGQSWERTAARVASCTSGVYGWAELDAHGTDPSNTLRSLRLVTSFLDGRAEEALALVEDLLFCLDFEDQTRLGEILIQARARQRATLASRASELARTHAARLLSPEAWLSDEAHGLGQIRLIERLAAGFAAADEQLIEQTVSRLLSLREAIGGTARLTVSFTGSPDERTLARGYAARWANRQPARAPQPIEPTPNGSSRRVGLASAMDVAYCEYVLPGPYYNDPLSSALQIASTYYRQQYVMDEVRLKGAAYGAWSSMNAFHGTFDLGSYRDPQPVRTLGVFGRALEGVALLDWSPSEIERAIVVTAKDSLRPNRPREATGSALWWHTHGLSDEIRTRHYEALLAVKPSEAREALERVLGQDERLASVCVVSSRDKLEAVNAELQAGKLEIEDVVD
ncbi:MAG: insulinase family protein [Polyangiaceae bacterium]|nr:insulinase family protein [Polyangiaceae bacterium]